jgi:dynein heavy chain 1
MKIKMQNQAFILDPPLAEARAFLYTQLHAQVEIICGLRRVEAQRYGRYRGQDSKREKTYNSLVQQMKSYSITEAYVELEKVLRASNNYFDIWKQYQALWDL